jgi:hypothetical protein
MIFIKDKEERVLSEDHKIKGRWREYFNHLLNTKNSSKELEETDIVEGPVQLVTEIEIKKQLDKMKNKKAMGPDEFPIEVIRKLGDIGLKSITTVLRDIQKGGIPAEWRKSRIVPIYKNKGDYLNCANYRQIKLLSHCFKL